MSRNKIYQYNMKDRMLLLPTISYAPLHSFPTPSLTMSHLSTLAYLHACLPVHHSALHSYPFTLLPAFQSIILPCLSCHSCASLLYHSTSTPLYTWLSAFLSTPVCRSVSFTPPVCLFLHSPVNSLPTCLLALPLFCLPACLFFLPLSILPFFHSTVWQLPHHSPSLPPLCLLHLPLPRLLACLLACLPVPPATTPPSSPSACVCASVRVWQALGPR